MLQKLLNIVDSTILSLTILREQLYVATKSQTLSREVGDRIVNILKTTAKKIVHAYIGSRYAFGLDKQFIVFDKEDTPDIEIYPKLNIKEYGKYMDVFVPIHKSILTTIRLLDDWGYYDGFRGAMNKSSSYQVERKRLPGSSIMIKHNGKIHAMLTEIYKKKGELPEDVHLYIMPSYIHITARRKEKQMILSRLITKDRRCKVVSLKA